MKLINILLDWLFEGDYCKGCKHSYRDSYGNMCLYSSVNYPLQPPYKQILTKDIKTRKKSCNLYNSQ